MRMSVDWNNLTLRAKDIVSLLVFVGGIIFVVATQNQKLNEIIENQNENKTLFRDLNNRQSVSETEIKLLKQRVDAWDNNNKSIAR